MKMELPCKGPKEPWGPECHSSGQGFQDRQVEPGRASMSAHLPAQVPTFARALLQARYKQTTHKNMDASVSPPSFDLHLPLAKSQI